ncbi:hypothetical protein [Fervidobacterium sp.]
MFKTLSTGRFLIDARSIISKTLIETTNINSPYRADQIKTSAINGVILISVRTENV